MGDDLLYKNPDIAVEERIQDLLNRMTLGEKICQMMLVERSALLSVDDITDYGFGALFSGGGSAPDENTPSGWADMYDYYQSFALENRLGIPLIYGVDAVDGL